MHRALTGYTELHDVICAQQKQQGEVNELQNSSGQDCTFIAIQKLTPPTIPGTTTENHFKWHELMNIDKKNLLEMNFQWGTEK